MWSRLKKCFLGHTGMMNITARVPCLPVLVLWGPVLLLFAASGAEEDSSQKRILAEVVTAQPFLRWEGQIYRNYALTHFANYPNHTTPYTDTPRSRYDFMGNFLMTGYDLYEWQELRTVGQKFGSSIFKDSNEGPWHSTFDYLVIGRDGYGDWGYNLIVGDAVIARFTPLTLSKVNFNGARYDLSMPRLQFTGLMSRIERPKDITRAVTEAFRRETHFADESTLLLGSRAQTHLGALTLGLNWVNQHVYRSAQPSGNSLKGRLKPGQPLMDWILVRFTDDSPTDGTGGAVVQGVQLVIDGEARPDLAPRVVRHRSNPTIRVGFASALGGFTPLNYRGFSASSGGTPAFNEIFYQNREFPYFSDYLFRLDHEAGIDVSKAADVDGLVSTFEVESPHDRLRADGEDELIFLFDMTGETSLQSVEVEALLGNDYQVDVAMLYVKSTGATAHHDRLSSTYYQTTLRSPGNVQDLSNLERVRFGVGENTANFVYSADLHLSLPGLEITGEYARSSVYSRYPGRMGEDPAFDASPRFVDRGKAYFVNAVHRFGRGLVGGEFFAINPGFQTEMRNYLNTASSLWLGHLDLALNNTMYWQLVEDNEDGDVYPDIRYGNAVGVPVDRVGTDLNGVWMGQDEDGDGTPDTNRNLNRTPDYEEPFLMFDVEPNTYAYGLDRNHNNEPDHREDDREVDYPYDHDERGFHLFSQWNLSPHLSFSMGRYDVEEIAGGGRNRVTYGLLGYRWQGTGRWRRLFLENGLRHVQDDIPDEIMTYDPDAGPRDAFFGGRGPFYTREADPGTGIPAFIRYRFVLDPLYYRDSYVNETYLEGRVHPWPRLEVVQKFRWRFNWLQGGRLNQGYYQGARRQDFWTWVGRVQYSWRWRQVQLTWQYKLMALRLVDRGRDVRLQSEYRSIPIVRLEYPLLERTTLRAGLQGIGPLPYRRKDHVSSQRSFEQRTAFVTLINRSRYFGYDLVTIAGISKDAIKFDLEAYDFAEFDTMSFFVRTLVGFTEFGRPI